MDEPAAPMSRSAVSGTESGRYRQLRHAPYIELWYQQPPELGVQRRKLVDSMPLIEGKNSRHIGDIHTIM